MSAVLSIVENNLYEIRVSERRFIVNYENMMHSVSMCYI